MAAIAELWYINKIEALFLISMDEEIKDRFTSTKPNIPKPEEFLIIKPEVYKEEK